MNDDLTLLASRYLDDDLPADERARVEGDTDLVAEVERLRGAREAIAGVEPPDAAQRERAIAAALAAFTVNADHVTDARAERPAAIAPPVASLAARRRARWLLPVAAAAVGVVALAGVAALSGGGGDDASDSAATMEELDAEAPAEQELSAGGAADTAGSDEAFAPAATTEGTEAGEVAAEGTTAAASASTAAADGAARFALLRTPDELVTLAVGGQPANTYSPPAPTERTDATAADTAFECDRGVVVARAYYQLDGTPVAVDVVIRGDDVLAVDIATCAIVARGELP